MRSNELSQTRQWYKTLEFRQKERGDKISPN